MEQLCITYFYPLTEQIELDLDYTPCIKFAEERARGTINQTGLRMDMWSIDSNGNVGIGVTANSVSFQPYFCIDVDNTPMVMRSKNKPNIIKRFIYKMLGIKWETK